MKTLPDHQCSYELECSLSNRYLTGFYLCSRCGSHKHIPSETVCNWLLRDVRHWEDLLRTIVTAQEQRLKRLRQQVKKARTLEFRQSIDCLQATLELYKQNLRQIEMNDHFLTARAENNPSMR